MSGSKAAQTLPALRYVSLSPLLSVFLLGEFPGERRTGFCECGAFFKFPGQEFSPQSPPAGP